MNKAYSCFLEEMTQDELSFLKSRYDSENKKIRVVLRRIIFVVVTAAVILAVIFSLGNFDAAPLPPVNGKPQGLSTDMFILCVFIAVILVVFIVGIAFGRAYYKFQLPLKKDLRERMKIVEVATIRQKKYMHQTDAYYFYLNNSRKLTVEVPPDFYNHYKEGDELNVEFAQYSGVEFGVF